MDLMSGYVPLNSQGYFILQKPEAFGPTPECYESSRVTTQVPC